MFKKVLLIVFLLFILVGNQALAPLKTSSTEMVSQFFPQITKISIAYAAEPAQQSSKLTEKTASVSLASYIVPGTAVIVLIICVGSYWFIFRKKQNQK